jgi:hypothetical protein
MQASNSEYKQVKLPNGKIGRFPESMSWESISDTLRQQFPMPEKNEHATQPQSEQNAVQQQEQKNPINNFTRNLQQGQVPAGLQHFMQNLPGNVLAGLAQGGHETLNIPYNLAKGAEHLTGNHQSLGRMLGIKAEDIPHQQEYDFVKGLGLPSETSDKWTRGLTKHSPDILGAPALAKGLYTLGAKGLGAGFDLLQPGKKAAQLAEKERLASSALHEQEKLKHAALTEESKAAEKSFNEGQNQKAQQFIEGLGGPKTSEENINEFAKRLHFGRNSAMEEALTHKRNVFDPLGEHHISAPLAREGERGPHLAPSPENGQYINEGQGFHNYDRKLTELRHAYIENPSLNHSDALRQQLGSETRRLTKLNHEGKLDRAGQDLLYEINHDSNLLLNDQNTFMRSQAPEFQREYEQFRNKWTRNVSIYDLHPEISRMARTPESEFYRAGEGVKPTDLKGVFGYPKTKATRIIQDIGPAGRNNVLLNEFGTHGTPQPKKLGEAIQQAKQSGFQTHMGPEMDLLAEELSKGFDKKIIPKLEKMKSGKKLLDEPKDLWDIALGTASGAVLGHPLLGALYSIMKKKH